MTITKCDRCGAEIDLGKLRKAYENGEILMTVVDNCHCGYDLCLNCLHDLERWMKGDIRTNNDADRIEHNP